MCYQVTADDLAGGRCDYPSAVPLGGPLLGTHVELRDEDGTQVDKGSGVIWIGKSNFTISVLYMDIRV